MSGIGPLTGPLAPDPLRPIDKDRGGGGGTGYFRREQEEEKHQDGADISEEARKRNEQERQKEAQAHPDANDARLEILSDIAAFNERHERKGLKLRARLMPSAVGSVLHVEDPSQGVSLKPFGDKDIFHASPQEVHTKLEVFDRSSGTLFDGKV